MDISRYKESTFIIPQNELKVGSYYYVRRSDGVEYIYEYLGHGRYRYKKPSWKFFVNGRMDNAGYPGSRICVTPIQEEKFYIDL